ncbi:hypothetical protein ESZ50_08745 [Weissella muntiaci]|uniref:Uncharacterized protein n=1 Tax=Weissella muntiaci TaxID=2508881 RepID=A0A6C2C422_9LACO|nr:hypothetical protein [Weissella muntiaci]TYC48439.1 hypothetical protein ESZ50_08745 [Weissella muntiaci]
MLNRRQKNYFVRMLILFSTDVRGTNQEAIYLNKAISKIENNNNFDDTIMSLLNDLENLNKDTVQTGGLTTRIKALFDDIKHDYGGAKGRKKYLIGALQLFINTAGISELSRMVLSNADQKLREGSMIVDDAIEYIMDWIQKIANTQGLVKDEKLARKIFSQQIYTSDLSLDELAELINAK